MNKSAAEIAPLTEEVPKLLLNEPSKDQLVNDTEQKESALTLDLAAEVVAPTIKVKDEEVKKAIAEYDSLE